MFEKEGLKQLVGELDLCVQINAKGYRIAQEIRKTLIQMLNSSPEATALIGTAKDVAENNYIRYQDVWISFHELKGS